MSSSYFGYIYIWYDTKSKFYYIGGHKGKVEDNYISSNKPMKRAYNLRPESFRFRVLEYIYGDVQNLRKIEQKWLNMIKEKELMRTENIKNKTCKYYNVKKHSSGGNGSANKGKNKISWNKGYTKQELKLRREGLLSFYPLDKPKIKIKNIIYNFHKKNCKNCNIIFNAKTIKNIFCCNSCNIKFYKKILISRKKIIIKKIKYPKISIEIFCIKCHKSIFTQNKNRRYCNSCRSSIAAKNLKINPMKIKEIAKKFSNQIKGRRIFLDENGKRHWYYPNKK